MHMVTNVTLMEKTAEVEKLFAILMVLFFSPDQGHCSDLLIFQTQPYSLLR